MNSQNNEWRLTVTYSSSHPDEIKHFEKDAEAWWDPEGPFKILHRMNPCRIGYLREKIIHHFNIEKTKTAPFEGLRILDIGCGGGILTEPLVRLGGSVTGIDAGEKNIKMASLHAEKSNLNIDYKVSTPEDLAINGELFDVITALEIVEHVTDPQQFLHDSSKLLKKNGLIFLSTLNKTLKSYALAILGAEYILRWVPQGSHQWDKFLSPDTLHEYLRNEGIRPSDLKGMSYNPLIGTWSLSHDLGINYIMYGVNDPSFSK